MRTPGSERADHSLNSGSPQPREYVYVRAELAHLKHPATGPKYPYIYIHIHMYKYIYRERERVSMISVLGIVIRLRGIYLIFGYLDPEGLMFAYIDLSMRTLNTRGSANK